MRVAFQGELGAYSDEAVRRFFGGRAEPVPHREFHEVAASVARGRVERGVLPIENTLVGSVVPTFDALATTQLAVVGEVVVPIHHCVLGVRGARIADVRRVLSHPVALAQCTRFLRAHPELEAVPAYDTAGAARQVAEAGDAASAAIAGRTAAERYGLDVLAADVEDRGDNRTRFVVVARAAVALDEAAAPAPGVPAKTMLLAELDNRPGALAGLLQPFARHEVNLAKLETRPGTMPWAYRFFLELEAAGDEPRVQAALAEARADGAAVQVLGSYARAVEPDDGGGRPG